MVPGARGGGSDAGAAAGPAAPLAPCAGFGIDKSSGRISIIVIVSPAKRGDTPFRSANPFAIALRDHEVIVAVSL